MEACAEDDRVDLALPSVVRDDRALANFGDPIRHQLDVRPAHRRQVIVRYQDALAARRIIGRELRAQFGIIDLAAQMNQGETRGERGEARMYERQRVELPRPVDRRSHQPLSSRDAPIEGTLEARERPCASGHDPRRDALEDVQPADMRLDPRRELDRGGARADHRDALAGQVRARASTSPSETAPP